MSVAHILKTAFKDVFDEQQKRIDAVDARALEKVILDKKRSIAIEAEKEADRRREAHAAALVEREAQIAALSKKKKGKKDLDADELPPEPQLDLTDLEPQPIPEESDPKLKLKGYYNRFEKLKLDNNFTDDFETKTTKINRNLVERQQVSQSMSSFLTDKRSQAIELEAAEEEGLKKQGVLVGQHIPALKSRLKIEPSSLNDYGDYSNNIVIAGVLVEQNKTNTLRRTGNLPISELAYQKEQERLARMPTQDEDKPHYLNTTGSTVNRESRIKTQFSMCFSLIETLKAQRVSSDDWVPRKKDLKLSYEQVANNEAVLKSLMHKMNYLRNPRNAPEGVTKMLTRAPREFQTDDISEEPHKPGAMVIKKKFTKLRDNPLFVSDPKIVNFIGYKIGEVYTKQIAFRNVSAVSRTMKVIPPTTKHFKISPLQFPPNSNAGLVAPGMSITTTVTFTPNAIQDYKDNLQIKTESGDIQVPIIVTTENPLLDIPPVIDIGACLVGDAVRIPIDLLNSGGAGVFRVCGESEYNVKCPLDIFGTRDDGCVRAPPFTIYPSQFKIGPNRRGELNIEFVPLEINRFSYNFVIIDDSNQVVKVTVIGTSKEISVNLQEINGSFFDHTDVKVKKDLYFEAKNVGCEASQTFVVTNETGSPLEYEWVFVDFDSRNIPADGRKKVKDREIAAMDRSLNTPFTKLHGSPKGKTPGGGGGVGGGGGGGGSHSSSASRHTKSDHSEKSRATGTTHIPGMTPDPDIKHSLAQSLNGEDEFANEVDDRCFRLSPARGVFASDGSATFTANFCPESIALCKTKAVLVIKQVHNAAMPDKKQKHHLEKLLLDGHGKYARLKSWLDDFGEPIKVEEYKKANGDTSDDARINNLKSVLDMVGSQAVDEIDSKKLLTLYSWVKQIIAHVALWKIGELDLGEEHELEEAKVKKEGLVTSESGSSNGNSSKISLPLFHWKNPTDARSAPSKVFPISIQINNNNNNQAEEQNDNGGSFELTAEDKLLMDEIYVDTGTALKLFGNKIGDVLDVKVKHEAVDYLRANALTNVVCLSLNICGEGKPQKLNIQPYHLFVPGDITISNPWKTSELSIFNPSSAIIEVEVQTELMKIEAYSDLHNDKTADIAGFNDSRLQVKPEFHVSFSPTRLLIMPESSAAFEMTLISHTLGHFHLTIPLDPLNSSGDVAVDPIHITCNIIPPTIRFNEPEVDVGLVGVSCEETKAMSLTNEGDVPVRYSLSCVLEVDQDSQSALHQNDKAKARGKLDGSSGSVSGGDDLTDRQSVHSARSSNSISEISSNHSAQSDNPDGSPSSHTKSVSATIRFGPVSDIVNPSCVGNINVFYKAGKYPQRVRGTIECKISDVTGKIPLGVQYLSLRGEVQAPKTVLYPMNFPLGRVYIGVPVKFQFYIENMCNLPTKYKLERPGGESINFRIEYERGGSAAAATAGLPSAITGPIGAKEKVLINAKFIALTPGLIDEVIACKIVGLPFPLGFSVKVVAKPVLLEFRQLSAGEDIPKPLAKETDAQFPGDGAVPDPIPVDFLDIGATALYQRRKLSFVVRNLSSIPTKYNISMKKFSVLGDLSILLKDLLSEGDDLQGRRDFILAPHEGGENKFGSQSGKAYVAEREMRKRDKKYLQSRKGASYIIEPISGLLPPWGVEVVTIRSFNDMPGCFNDHVQFSYVDNEIEKVNSIPLKMTVSGCPFLIESNTLGMTVVKKVDAHKSEKLLGRQLLHLGYGCQNCDPLAREFVVRNNGSQPATITWKFQSLSSVVNGPLKIKVGAFDSGYDERGKGIAGGRKSKVQFLYWDDIAKDYPFKIEPETAFIPAYGRHEFKVTLFRTNDVGSLVFELMGALAIKPEADKKHQQHHQQKVSISGSGSSSSSIDSGKSSSKDSSDNSAESTSNFSVNLLLEGNIAYPSIKMDKSILEVSNTNTVIDAQRGIKLKTKAPIIFADQKSLFQECSRQLTITNPLEAFLSFNVSTTGPFILKSVDEVGGGNNNNNGNISSSVNESSTQQHGSSGGGGSSPRGEKTSLGKFLRLNPQFSHSFKLLFTPQRDMREAALANIVTDSAKEIMKEGALIFSFSTGQSLKVPISSQIATPFIVASSPKIYLGVCHVVKSCEGTILLSNPTDVTANWSISHVPGGKKKASAIVVPGYEEIVEVDDPTCWSFTPDSGTVDGPTLSIASAMSAPPKDDMRLQDTLVPQRFPLASWKSETCTLQDIVSKRHEDQHKFEADAFFPKPITILFAPKKNVKYLSRFRVSCQFGNSFDILVQGEGTYEENLHAPIFPIPR